MARSRNRSPLKTGNPTVNRGVPVLAQPLARVRVPSVQMRRQLKDALVVEHALPRTGPQDVAAADDLDYVQTASYMPKRAACTGGYGGQNGRASRRLVRSARRKRCA